MKGSFSPGNSSTFAFILGMVAIIAIAVAAPGMVQAVLGAGAAPVLPGEVGAGSSTLASEVKAPQVNPGGLADTGIYGTVGIGTASPLSPLHIYSTTSTQPETIDLSGVGPMTAQWNNYYNGSSAGSGFLARFARGTKGAESNVLVGDRLGFIVFGGWAGGAFRHTAGITGVVDTGTVSATSLPTYLAFTTTANGSVARAERMRIASDGKVAINTTTPDSTSQLTVSRDGGSSIFGTNTSGTGVYGRNGNSGNIGYLGHPTYGAFGQYGGNWGSLGNSLYGVSGYGSGSNTGVYGQSSTGIAVSGTSTSGTGVYGTSTSGAGLNGQSTTNYGVYATSNSGTGVYGRNVTSVNYGVLGSSTAGVGGTSTSNYGVDGTSTSSYGVKGTSTSSYGVYGLNSGTMNYGALGTGSNGVYGISTSSDAVYGQNGNSGNIGTLGTSTTGASGIGTGSNTGVNGTSYSGNGVYGTSGSGNGVYGLNSNSGNYGSLGAGSNGVNGYSASGTGVNGVSGSGNAVYGTATSGNGIFGTSTSGAAGYFVGNVVVTGTMSKGGGTFKIDHPRDPENKYLSHSFVESPEMMNVYRGHALLDEQGEALVTMPSYFEALNRDFEYQLTCIGGYAPVYVAEKVKDNIFKIAGGSPGLEVSWQITGIRQDAFASAHPIVVEQEKPDSEKGFYLHPVEWGQPKEKGIDQVTGK